MHSFIAAIFTALISLNLLNTPLRIHLHPLEEAFADFINRTTSSPPIFAPRSHQLDTFSELVTVHTQEHADEYQIFRLAPDCARNNCAHHVTRLLQLLRCSHIRYLPSLNLIETRCNGVSQLSAHQVGDFAEGHIVDIEKRYDNQMIQPPSRGETVDRNDSYHQRLLEKSEMMVPPSPMLEGEENWENDMLGSVGRFVQEGFVPWGLDRIDQQKGRDRKLDLSCFPRLGLGIDVYLLDSGCHATHQEFEGRVELVKVGRYKTALDYHGHGTHIAGIVAGKTYGVCKGCKVVCVKTLDEENTGTLADVLSSIDYIVSRQKSIGWKPNVAVLSLGGELQTDLLDNGIEMLLKARVIPVVAAGNGGTDACRWTPARSDSAITVAASTMFDLMRWSSNGGACIDIAAPGEFITSAAHYSDTAARYMSGTSMAAPHVAGAVALILAENPSLTMQEVLHLLKRDSWRVQDVVRKTTYGLLRVKQSHCSLFGFGGTPTNSKTPTPSLSRTPVPSRSNTPSPSMLNSRTPFPSMSLSASTSRSPRPSRTPSPSASRSPSPSISKSSSPSASRSPMPSMSVTPSPSLSMSKTPSPSASMSRSPHPSRTPSQSPSPSISKSQSPYPTRSPTPTPSETPSLSPSASRSSTLSPSYTPSSSPSKSRSPSPSMLRSPSMSITLSSSPSRTSSSSPFASESSTPKPSRTPSVLPSVMRSPPPSVSSSTSSPHCRSATPKGLQTPSPSPSPSRLWSLMPNRSRTPSPSASRNSPPSPSISLASFSYANAPRSLQESPSSHASRTALASTTHFASETVLTTAIPVPSGCPFLMPLQIYMVFPLAQHSPSMDPGKHQPLVPSISPMQTGTASKFFMNLPSRSASSGRSVTTSDPSPSILMTPIPILPLSTPIPRHNPNYPSPQYESQSLSITYRAGHPSHSESPKASVARNAPDFQMGRVSVVLDNFSGVACSIVKLKRRLEGSKAVNFLLSLETKTRTSGTVTKATIDISNVTQSHFAACISKVSSPTLRQAEGLLTLNWLVVQRNGTWIQTGTVKFRRHLIFLDGQCETVLDGRASALGNDSVIMPGFRTSLFPHNKDMSSSGLVRWIEKFNSSRFSYCIQNVLQSKYSARRVVPFFETYFLVLATHSEGRVITGVIYMPPWHLGLFCKVVELRPKHSEQKPYIFASLRHPVTHGNAYSSGSALIWITNVTKSDFTICAEEIMWFWEEKQGFRTEATIEWIAVYE